MTKALEYVGKAIERTDGRVGKAGVIRAAAPLPGLVEKLAEAAPQDGLYQAELARYFTERGDKPLAEAARSKARAVFESRLAKEPANAALAADLADALLIDTRWTALKPVTMKTAAGATLTREPDRSLFVSGKLQNKESYTLAFENVPGKIARFAWRRCAMTGFRGADRGLIPAGISSSVTSRYFDRMTRTRRQGSQSRCARCLPRSRKPRFDVPNRP